MLERLKVLFKAPLAEDSLEKILKDVPGPQEMKELRDFYNQYSSGCPVSLGAQSSENILRPLVALALAAHEKGECLLVYGFVLLPTQVAVEIHRNLIRKVLLRSVTFQKGKAKGGIQL